ncbi:MAG TPA: hypothetical protein VIG49_01550 [Acetobacteraceae bacterium]
MSDRSRIDAAALDGVRLSSDGARLILLLRDTAGQKLSPSLPANCLSAMLTAAPRPAETGTAHAVDSWDMSLAGNGQDMILTLCTPEGMAMSFTIKPWQVQGMVTLATYGAPRQGTGRSIH